MNTPQSVPSTWFDISAAELFAEIGATRQVDYDQLPFGAIALSPDGKVVTYNAAESAFSGLNPSDVIGRDFFRDIAPCARVQKFGGVIESAEPGSTIDTSLVFTFRFVQGWRQAKIRIVRNPDVSPLTFIFVSPLGMVNSSRTSSKIAPGKPN
jgi:photoactive yellow protein